MVKELTIFIRLKVVYLAFKLYFMHVLTKKDQILMHQLTTTSIWMKMRLMTMNLVGINLRMMKRKKKSIVPSFSSNLSEEYEQQHLIKRCGCGEKAYWSC